MQPSQESRNRESMGGGRGGRNQPYFDTSEFGKENLEEVNIDYSLLKFLPEIGISDEIEELRTQMELNEGSDHDNAYLAIDYIINCEQDESMYNL